nr:FAD-dependent oxidoreductase [Nitratireductor sp. XY-223]
MKKRIAIVGGGFAGAELAKSLEEKADVTLIEQNTHFVHTPAMVRATVDPSLLDRALIPYEKLLKKGRIVHGRAQSVDATGVTMDDGEQIEADYTVIATGSAYAAPFKAKDGEIDGLRAANAQINRKLRNAKTIAIVGAGAVGTELAGEIKHAMPDKKVTLISADKTLFPGFPDKLGNQLGSKLRAAGVDVILGAMAENLKSLTEPYAGSLTLDNGQHVDADLIFPVVGSRARPELLESLPGAKKSSSNRIKVDQWMRPSDLPNVFAVGDVADNGDPMTVVAINRQEPWLSKTLLALAKGAKVENQRPYTAANKSMILIPLGPNIGNSFLAVATVGNFLTRLFKGKDLFLTKYNNSFGR